MTYNKIATYIALPVFAFSAFAISVIAISPEVSAATGNGSGGAPAPELTPAQKKAIAKAKEEAAEKKKKEAIAAAKAQKEKVAKQIRSSYTDCIAGVSELKKASTIQGMNDRLLKDRTGRIKQLNKTVDKLSNAERKEQLQALLTSDQEQLDAIYASSKGSTDTAVLTKSYCEAIWKLQIKQFRAKQIAYIIYVDKQIAAQAKLEKGVDAATATVNANNNPAKKQVLEQLAAAKSTLRAGLEANGAAAFQVMGAKVSMVDGNYVNNLEKPTEYGIKTMSSYQSALLDYTESVVTRKVANQFDPNLTSKVEVTAITLKDKNGNKINVQRTTKDNPKTEKVDESGKTVISYKAKEARTAVVQVRVDGKDKTFTLTREGPKAKWVVNKD